MHAHIIDQQCSMSCYEYYGYYYTRFSVITDEVQPCFPSGMCESMQEARGLSGRVSQQLICGRCTDCFDMRTKPECKILVLDH